MDPVIDNDWLSCKNDPVNELPRVASLLQGLRSREYGLPSVYSTKNKSILENIAEDILVQKPLKIRCCDLPGYPRSTFLMVFSPDGTKVASTHGNHNVYVSELSSGKNVRILTGHPRTPWCIAFHPSHSQLIGSGCLGGQVRVWDISSGGSEVWNVRNETPIASIAFHPREQLLVIATSNELYFWDWSQPAPFTRVSTNNINEKVRYVAFDALGYKLITGISISLTSNMGPSNNNSNVRREENDETPSQGNRSQENSGTTQDMIVTSYQNLVQRYDSLVRNYQRLFMVRHRLTNTPPPPSTTDRGTDPMEPDATSPWPSPSSLRPAPAPVPSTSRDSGDTNTDNPRPGTSSQPDGDADGDSAGSRLLNLDVLSLGGNTPRSQDEESPDREEGFGSWSSAFQPLTERRRIRPVDLSERSYRLLPNPFSSSASSRPSRTSFTDGSQRSDSTAHTSRTSIFTSSTPETFLQRRRNLPLFTSILRRQSALMNLNSSSEASTQIPRGEPPAPAAEPPPRPAMTNSSTQMSPTSNAVDAQTINESLDLIRDILRDSGTRLLNLITNMSLSTLVNVERTIPRRGARAHSASASSGGESRARLFPAALRRDFLSSSSDSDSDHSLEVNILRTRNSTFREEEVDLAAPSTSARAAATDRMEFDINDATRDTGEPHRDTGGINVSLSNRRFRVRTQSESAAEDAGHTRPAAEAAPPAPTAPAADADFDPDRPSTSRDNFWTRGSVMPPEEAYRRVKGGVHALQKHTIQLTNMWLRGNRVTMRELRCMWWNLRRRILVLHRETGRQDLPSYYTRSLLERCMMLTEVNDSVSRAVGRNTRYNLRSESNERNDGESGDANSPSGAEPGTSGGANAPGTQRRSGGARAAGGGRAGAGGGRAGAARRRAAAARWRPEDEIRRRSRNPPTIRMSPRFTRTRRDNARAIEISATRHEIRMRAMQVLSTMFNMMMMCLEERGLSQVIINMLRILKKALALTCIMLMMNRNQARAGATPPAATRVEPLNVVRIQHVEHPGPINVDSLDEPGHADNADAQNEVRADETEDDKPSTSKTDTPGADAQSNSPEASTSEAADQRWSSRLAVAIAAANRNNSLTASKRRELYLEAKREKALHKTNPTAHPLIKKRSQPPATTYRIPALRCLPTKVKLPRQPLPRTEPPPGLAEEPVAGPSSGVAPADDPRGPRQLMNVVARINMIRLAHINALRVRNASRNRFRRLQTIRLYTPSSVREMFEFQSNNPEGGSGRRSPSQSGPEGGAGAGGRRLFPYRTHLLARGEAREEPAHFHTLFDNVAMPLMQVNDLPAAADAQNSPPQRLPRIHNYLQPILLAQNAMVVDDEAGGEGGGPGPRRVASVLDASLIPDSLPSPLHRVQAWDFTTGDPPDIADRMKNVVVQRCKIHNDASIDISKDGRLLVALLPEQRFRNSHGLGVYSLEWSRLGQCLHSAVFEQSAVSVALSPTARHLAVGLGSRRFTTTPHGRNNVFALLYRMETPEEFTPRNCLTPIKELEQNWEHGFTSLNCLRWAPHPGQGLVYANNTGQLIIMS